MKSDGRLNVDWRIDSRASGEKHVKRFYGVGEHGTLNKLMCKRPGFGRAWHIQGTERRTVW